MSNGTVQYETEHQACFANEPNPAASYADWRQQAKYRKVGRSSFCHDCTQAFQAKSIAVGLCEFPETKFVRNEEEGWHGVRRKSERLPTAIQKRNQEWEERTAS